MFSLAGGLGRVGELRSHKGEHSNRELWADKAAHREEKIDKHVKVHGGDELARAKVGPEGELEGHYTDAVDQERRRSELHHCAAAIAQVRGSSAVSRVQLNAGLHKKMKHLGESEPTVPTCHEGRRGVDCARSGVVGEEIWLGDTEKAAQNLAPSTGDDGPHAQDSAGSAGLVFFIVGVLLLETIRIRILDAIAQRFEPVHVLQRRNGIDCYFLIGFVVNIRLAFPILIGWR